MCLCEREKVCDRQIDKSIIIMYVCVLITCAYVCQKVVIFVWGVGEIQTDLQEYIMCVR